MIIIFDTFGGLCNQIYDINSGINFCIINNIKFTFRCCSFRDKNLGFFNKSFNELFDISAIIEKYKHLYVDISTINLTNQNTYNLHGLYAINLFTDNFFKEIIDLSDKFEFILLKQFWSVYKFRKIIDNLNFQIQPNEKILNLYNTIKNKVLKNDEQYNFIHYRYEADFVNYFKVDIKDLKTIIFESKPKFKNPNLKIYIACSNIKTVLDLNDNTVKDVIIYKNEDDVCEYNFEELAFVDFLFGLNSTEVFGHDKSSFSGMLNNYKNTHNFYNL
jgi:hypothetical protein